MKECIDYCPLTEEDIENQSVAEQKCVEAMERNKIKLGKCILARKSKEIEKDAQMMYA